MTLSYEYTWEQAVDWMRKQPDKQDLVRACYYDDPIEKSASRFHDSEEWHEIMHVLGRFLPCRVLDIGAGRGISSYAFAKQGCEVTAIEPDPSPLVGIAAIKNLTTQTGLPIKAVRGYGESLPFKGNSYDIVYGRAILHHACDLHNLCKNAARVLKPGGIFIVTREHVVSRRQDLDTFLRSHPLHFLYGGENAYLLSEYKAAIKLSGLKLLSVLGPYDSVINYAPISYKELQGTIATLLTRFTGKMLSNSLVNNPMVFQLMSFVLSLKSQTPGRLYSFIAVKR